MNRSMRSYFTGRRLIGYLLIALAVLVVSDGIVTDLLIKTGLGREGNPLLQLWAGTPGFLILKVVGALLSAFILWDIYKRWPKLALISTALFIVAYSGIVLWNLSIFFSYWE